MFSAAKTSSPSGTYTISRSVRLRSSATAYFSKTPTSGNLRKWTYSCWVKRGLIGSASQYTSIFTATLNSSFNDSLYFNVSTDTIVWNVSNTLTALVTTQVFRDPSAWYHFVFVWDTDNATAANRARIYVNGVEITSFSTDNRASIANRNSTFNSNVVNYIGGSSNAVLNFDGYMAETNFIDGQALTPSSFGEYNTTTGVWQPKRYTGTYGTNGFYLNFSDNSNNTAATIGKDYSGNGNNWTPNNISVTAGATYDSMIDVPTMYADGGNGRGNYCVLNPLTKSINTVSDGNLNASGTAVIAASTTFAYPSSGKWYCEIQITSTPENLTGELVGITNDVGLAANVVRAYASNGQYYNGSTFVAFGSAWSTNSVIGVAADIDNSLLSFYLNGVLQGSAQSYTFTSISAPMLRARSAGTSTFVANFGQRPFSYTPPTGYVALNTQNLPSSTIVNGAQYMAATTYTGTGSTQSINNGNNTTIATTFQPDWVWIKSRSLAEWHGLYDAVRGVGKVLFSNSANPEVTNDVNGYLSALNSNGFTVTAGSSGSAGVNQSAATYVAWQWKAAGSSVSNTSGTITSTVNAGATQGFSVVKFTASTNGTVGHGLGVAPKMVIYKVTDTAGYGWIVYHSGITNSQNGGIYLQSTAAWNSDSTLWNNTAPTSSVFTVGSYPNGKATVAYCFAEVSGFSKFGSYTGNGSADGPFVYLGFRPRFIMFKAVNNLADWGIYDTSRSTYNVVNSQLDPNGSAAEYTSGRDTDILSNGFKVRNSNGGMNTSGNTYIYAAFAEVPFKSALGR
jgi:hypothetical protein